MYLIIAKIFDFRHPIINLIFPKQFFQASQKKNEHYQTNYSCFLFFFFLIKIEKEV